MPGIRSDGQRPEQQLASTEQLLAALRQASHALQEFLIAEARAGGLGLLEFLTLIRAGAGDGVTTHEAGRALRVGPSTMTGLADRLEEDGFIRRNPYPGDRRQVLLRATAKGRSVLERRLGPALSELAELSDSLDPAARESLARFLEQTAERLVALALAAPPPRRPPSPGSVHRRPPRRIRKGGHKKNT